MEKLHLGGRGKERGGYGIVWLKRDVRLNDHEPLHRALEEVKKGIISHVLVIYVYEEDLIYNHDFSSCHLKFINDGLREFAAKIHAIGGILVTLRGTVPSVFDSITPKIWNTNDGSDKEDSAENLVLRKIFVHEETGNKLSRDRITRVKNWAEANRVEIRWFNQTGVTKNLQQRDGWASKWKALMERASLPSPTQIGPKGTSLTLTGLSNQSSNMGIVGGVGILWEEELGIPRARKPEAMCGGESHAMALLRTFTEGKRSVGYGKNVSSPNTAWEGCSRLSPYLTWGHISLRTVYKSIKTLRERLKHDESLKKSNPSTWARDLAAFEARLRWRSHFMQKLEDDPSMEFENLCSTYDSLRTNSRHLLNITTTNITTAGTNGNISTTDVNISHTNGDSKTESGKLSQNHLNLVESEDRIRGKFQAWCSGNTGYPMVDAVMRALHKGGWINFRMRAMLVSFASYILWLDWRPTARYLAPHFLDFEPGIHYPQFQMQSGTTGINAVRIYNPTKQAKDHDKDGKFIKSYLPELQHVPVRYIHEPWKMPKSVQERANCTIGEIYPNPIVDQAEMYKFARKAFGDIKRLSKSKEEAKDIQFRHGSRKRPARRAFVRSNRPKNCTTTTRKKLNPRQHIGTTIPHTPQKVPR